MRCASATRCTRSSSPSASADREHDPDVRPVLDHLQPGLLQCPLEVVQPGLAQLLRDFPPADLDDHLRPRLEDQVRAVGDCRDRPLDLRGGAVTRRRSRSRCRPEPRTTIGRPASRPRPGSCCPVIPPTRAAGGRTGRGRRSGRGSAPGNGPRCRRCTAAWVRRCRKTAAPGPVRRSPSPWPDPTARRSPRSTGRPRPARRVPSRPAQRQHGRDDRLGNHIFATGRPRASRFRDRRTARRRSARPRGTPPGHTPRGGTSAGQGEHRRRLVAELPHRDLAAHRRDDTAGGERAANGSTHFPWSAEFGTHPATRFFPANDDTSTRSPRSVTATSPSGEMPDRTTPAVVGSEARTFPVGEIDAVKSLRTAQTTATFASGVTRDHHVAERDRHAEAELVGLRRWRAEVRGFAAHAVPGAGPPVTAGPRWVGFVSATGGMAGGATAARNGFVCVVASFGVGERRAAGVAVRSCPPVGVNDFSRTSRVLLGSRYATANPGPTARCVPNEVGTSTTVFPVPTSMTAALEYTRGPVRRPVEGLAVDAAGVLFPRGERGDLSPVAQVEEFDDVPVERPDQHREFLPSGDGYAAPHIGADRVRRADRDGPDLAERARVVDANHLPVVGEQELAARPHRGHAVDPRPERHLPEFAARRHVVERDRFRRRVVSEEAIRADEPERAEAGRVDPGDGLSGRGLVHRRPAAIVPNCGEVLPVAPAARRSSRTTADPARWADLLAAPQVERDQSGRDPADRTARRVRRTRGPAWTGSTESGGRASGSRANRGGPAAGR